MKRIIALILVALSLLAFASCADTDKTDMSWAVRSGETEVSYPAFYSELFGYKNDFLQGYLGMTEDNANIWAQDSPSGNNETVGDSLKRMALEDIVQFAWVVDYGVARGAELNDEDLSVVEDGMASVRENFETEEDYTEYLSMLGFTEDTIREYLKLTLMYDKGFELLIAENGPYHLTEEDYDKYYNDNYFTVKHIFVNNVSKIDEEGNEIALTEEEAKAQTEKAERIFADLEGGEEFDTLFMLSEDEMSVSYPDGITFTHGMISDTNYVGAVEKLAVGEYTKVEGENGGVYIIKKLDLSEADREEYDEYVMSAVHSELQEKIYADHKNDVTVNYDAINQCDINEIPVM